ncbi:hypothetical protein B5X24_HaOG200898 [Helicoverpa armigera]|nr:hypothetical protein B5X24_HaOG200898 [Helicoverpa armigera]
MFIKAVMIIQIFCGLYNKISSNRIICAITKIYCALVIAAIVIIAVIHIFFFNIFIVAKSSVVISVTTYVLYAMVHFYFNGDHFNEFFYSLKHLQTTHGSESKYDISITIFLLISISSARLYGYLKFTFMHISILPIDEFTGLFLDLLVCNISHTTCVIRYLMFELLWRRMAILRKRLEQDLLNARRFENEEGVLRRQLRSCLSIYNEILDTTRKNGGPMKLLVIHLYIIFLKIVPLKLTNITVVLLVPQTLNHMFGFLLKNAIGSELTVVDMYILFFETLSPALLAEMVQSEIECMKLSIVKQLLVCKDERTLNAIQDATTYLEQNPFKYTIWRVFAVDMSLILNMIALLTTYTVAMVQFAHFYD